MDYIIKIYKDWKLHSEFTAIVSDMDDDYMFSEKQSIRESARSLKKYGSTCNHVRNNEILIKHEVQKSDTLQGIALKYGCTTEQIRRANRLFASDSLFLRQYLMVPIDKSSPYYNKDEHRPQSLPIRALSATAESSSDPHQNNNNSKSMDSVAIMSPEEENKKCIDEFLGKIDSTIAESKKYVAKSKYKTDIITSQSDDDLFTTGGSSSKIKRRIHSSSNSNSSSSSSHYQNYHSQPQHNYQQHNRHSSSGSTTDTIQLLNLNSSDKRVQTSLQRLEKQQDEFFEL